VKTFRIAKKADDTPYIDNLAAKISRNQLYEWKEQITKKKRGTVIFQCGQNS
jgi:hypothetical protein